MPPVLYLYAIAPRDSLSVPSVGGVDGAGEFTIVEHGGIAALAGIVDGEAFSQEAIDARAADLDWIGGIGWRHQETVTAVRRSADAIPVRAFTLFSSEEALRAHLAENEGTFESVLGRIRGREEWTMQVEFDDAKWSAAVERRSSALAPLLAEAEAAPEGRAYLLRKKVGEARKNAAREEEDRVVAEIEEKARSEFASPLVAERRQTRSGTFPQINLLLPRDAAPRIRAFADGLSRAYGEQGVSIRLTGPWPPYTFVRSGA